MATAPAAPRQLGAPHPGRPPGIRVIALSLDAEAYQLLQQMAPTRRAYGRFLSRLVFEERARREERRRLLQEARPTHE
jgi:hypothetical protein